MCGEVMVGLVSENRRANSSRSQRFAELDIIESNVMIVVVKLDTKIKCMSSNRLCKHNHLETKVLENQIN